MKVTNQIAHQAYSKYQSAPAYKEFNNKQGAFYLTGQAQMTQSKKNNPASFKGDLNPLKKTEITKAVWNSKYPEPLIALGGIAVLVLGIITGNLSKNIDTAEVKNTEAGYSSENNKKQRWQDGKHVSAKVTEPQKLTNEEIQHRRKVQIDIANFLQQQQQQNLQAEAIVDQVQEQNYKQQERDRREQQEQMRRYQAESEYNLKYHKAVNKMSEDDAPNYGR